MKKINILIEYSNFANVFLSDLTVKLPEKASINNYQINLVDSK